MSDNTCVERVDQLVDCLLSRTHDKQGGLVQLSRKTIDVTSS